MTVRVPRYVVVVAALAVLVGLAAAGGLSRELRGPTVDPVYAAQPAPIRHPACESATEEEGREARAQWEKNQRELHRDRLRNVRGGRGPARGRTGFWGDGVRRQPGRGDRSR